MSTSLQGWAGLSEQDTLQMSQALRSSSPSFIPQLYMPPDDQSDDDSDWLGSLTLRQVFKWLFVDASPIKQSTIDLYYDALKNWERLTGDPVVMDIGPDCLQRFSESALDPTHGSSTCNRWFRHIAAILNHLGPKSSRNKRARKALGYFGDWLWIEKLEEKEPDPIALKDWQIDALYNACTVARWPLTSRTRCEPADWWRCVLAITISYGPRRDDWYYLPTSAIDFCEDQFRFVAKKTGKLHELVLNPVTRWHLERLYDGHRDLLFNPTKSRKQLGRDWLRIQEAAGILPVLRAQWKRTRDEWIAQNPAVQPPRLKTQIDFQDLRATCAARYHKYFPGTAEILLGHAMPRNSKVTYKSYLGKQLLEPVWEAIRTIPQPASFLAALQTTN